MSRRWIAWTAGLALVGSAAAQPEAPGLPSAELSPAVVRALEAPYLTEDERREARIRHGAWEAGDLDTPARTARAALQRGAFDHPSFTDRSVDPRDRAEAAIGRGELRRALELLGAEGDVRSLRLRAQVLAGLGRMEEADRTLDGLVAALQARVVSAPELAEGVAGLMLRERLAGTRRRVEGEEEQREGVRADFETMVQLLARARDELDRIGWESRVVEAELLYEKHNRAQAIEAAIEVLGLNTGCARAWALLGRASVDSFDFSRAVLVAERLDELAGSVEGGAGGASMLGDLVRARERIRQRDPDGAAAVLDGLLSRFPRHREAVALRAAASAVAFEDDALAEWLSRFDELSPGAPGALFEVGAALSEARQYTEAADFLKRASDRLPAWPEPLIELGLLEMQSGRDLAARDALVRATRLDPFNARAENSLKLIVELLAYSTVESPHFVVRFRPGIDEMLAREMLPTLETIHSRVSGVAGIDHEPAQKTVIELMPDHRWFSVRITGMPGVHTMAASTGPVIAMESPREGPGHEIGEYDWARVIQHEYTHTVTLSRTHNRIPHWFTEAAAVYMEHAPRSWDWCQLLAQAYHTGTLFDLDEISLRFVRPIKPMDRTQAYAQGHWMYEFIVETFGERAPLDLMDRYAAGQGQEEALVGVLGVGKDAFMDQFRVWAREDLRRWGMLSPEGMPTIHELRREFFSRPDAPGDIDDQTLSSWLEAYPAHPDVLEMAAKRALGKAEASLSDETVALLERYSSARPVDPLPRRALVKHYLAMGRSEAAIPHLRWFDEREQTSPAYAAELAVRLSTLGRAAEGLDRAERATRCAPFDASLRELAARTALLAGDRVAARRHLSALTVIEPDREVHQRRLEALDRLGG
ncbi:MAG: hypothetical protein H6811_07050 [Phycisphaeraceae bacterium]|nr:hypothetical protein [Phycisphaeraceae bacterium]